METSETSLRRDLTEIRNRVVLQLRPAAQEFFSKRALTREIYAGEVLFEEGAPFTHAVFPHEGVISLMAEMEDGRAIEKTSIGHEGFIGFSLLMGGNGAISRTVVQVPGYASWLAVDHLEEALSDFICVRDAMLRYAKSLIFQTMESVACNGLHTAEQRISRWLMHALDRVRGDRFAVTQQALAEVLGLRRQTVSEVCSQLHQEGIIDYSRGTLTVVRRDELQQRSCNCYQRVRRASLL